MRVRSMAALSQTSTEDLRSWARSSDGISRPMTDAGLIGTSDALDVDESPAGGRADEASEPANDDDD
jgi:hypothetical protein